MSMFRFLSLLLALGLAACSNQPAEPQIFPPPPQWYVTPEANNQQWLIGVAGGADLEQAIAAARQDLLARINHEIESGYPIAQLPAAFGPQPQLKHNIRQQIADIGPGPYQLQRSSRLDVHRYAVQIRVARQALVQRHQHALDSRLALLRQRMQQAGNSDALVQEQQARHSITASRKLAASIIILASLDDSFKQQPYLDQLTEFVRQHQQLKHSLQFTLYNQYSAQQPLQVLKQALLDRGYTIELPSQRAGAFQLRLSSHGERSRSHSGAHIVRRTLDISVVNHRNRQVAANRLQLTGHASTGFEQAELAAFNQLTQLIEQQGLFAVLGVAPPR